MKLKFKPGRPPFEEPLDPIDARFKGCTLHISSEPRKTSENAWAQAKDRKSDQAANGMKFANLRNEKAIVGWSGLTLAMLDALKVPTGTFDVVDDDGDQDRDGGKVDFDREMLSWLMNHCPEFDRRANKAVRRAYGEGDDDEPMPVTPDVEEVGRKKP